MCVYTLCMYVLCAYVSLSPFHLGEHCGLVRMSMLLEKALHPPQCSGHFILLDEQACMLCKEQPKAFVFFDSTRLSLSNNSFC